jgi:hypothetical protein
MAVTIPNTDAPGSIAWPALDDAALDGVIVDYAPDIDYLYVFLAEKPVAAVWDLRADNLTYVGLRLVGDDEWTNEAVGIMVENFRLVASREHPGWERVLTAEGEARRAALRNLIADVAAMPAIDAVSDDQPAP